MYNPSASSMMGIANFNIRGCLEFLVKTSMTTMIVTNTKPTDDREAACSFKYKGKFIYLLYLVKQPEFFSVINAHISVIAQYFVFRINNT